MHYCNDLFEIPTEMVYKGLILYSQLGFNIAIG